MLGWTAASVGAVLCLLRLAIGRGKHRGQPLKPAAEGYRVAGEDAEAVAARAAESAAPGESGELLALRYETLTAAVVIFGLATLVAAVRGLLWSRRARRSA